MANEGAPQDAATSLPAGGATGTGQADAQNYNSSSTITSTEDGFAATTEITINIKTLRGNDFKLEVAPDMAVSALKTLVRERTGVDEDRQRLIYRGRVLADAEPLSTYKVETGHSLHMVATPLGFTPPSGNATAATATGSSHDSTTQGSRASTLGQRLLMGMGVPMTAGGEQNRSGGNAGGNVGDPTLMSAAGLDGGQFLTNMLGLAGAGGASAGAGGGTLGDLLTSSPTQHPQALWNAIEGRATRGQSRPATAATGGGARGAVDTDESEGGGRADGEDGQTDLEHVRQGLLTLHTLLSTTRRRSRRGAGRARAAGGASAVVAGTTTDGATASYLSRSLSPSAARRRRRWPHGLTMSNSPPSASSLNTISAARNFDSAAATTDQPENSSAGQNDKISRPPSPAAVGVPLAAYLGPHQASVETPADHKSESDGTSPVLTDDSAAEPYRRVRGGNAIGAPLFPGSSTAWLPPSDAVARPAAVSSSGGQKDENGDNTIRGVDGVSGAARIEPRWPFASEGVVRRRSEVHGSVAGSEAGSDLCAGLSFPEGPPRLLSSSGESTSDGWEDERHSRSLGTFFRVLQTDNSGDVEEEKKDQEDFQQESDASGGTRKFFVGQWLDVKDTVHNWLEATVMDISDSGRRLQIHYNGWPPRWDEWLSWDSPRIAPFRTRTQHLPHSQHVSPAPISAVRNAPITGLDDVRVVMPEVSRVLQEIGPMVEELSACYARSLERDTSADPMGERAVSHTLPWPRQRVNDEVAASVAASDASPKIAELAGDVAPLLDRLGRMLTDVAPHLARLGNSTVEDGVEPGEVHGRSHGRRSTGSTRSRVRRSHARSLSPDRAPATAFRQLVSTSSPAPTSSNINIHIHAIVPLRAPPSPPPPPPPPPPTAAVSAVATPTRAERPPLAVAGSRNSPWAGGLDAVGASASLLAAARAAATSRASASRESETSGGGTPRSAGRGIVTGSPRSFGTRVSGDEGAAAASAGGSATGGGVARSRSVSLASSASLVAVVDIPRSASTSGSSAAVHSEPSGGMSSSSARSTRSDIVTGPDQASSDLSTTGQNGGQRRTGGWRSLLRALGVGGNGSNSRVGGRRDGGEGDSAP